MPLGQYQGIPRADPGGRVTPRFWHRLIRFRRFCSGSLALASLDRACLSFCSDLTATLTTTALTAAACSGLRSAPVCRTRRALLHLSYSCAQPCGPATLVTHVESRGGIAPPRAPRTVREPLDSYGSRCSAVAITALPCPRAPPVTGWPVISAEQRSPFGPAPLQSLHPYYELLRPCAARQYSRPRGWSRLRLVPSRHRRDAA